MTVPPFLFQDSSEFFGPQTNIPENSIYDMNRILASNQGRFGSIVPQHFSGFLFQFRS
jgi:hypothetical protein